MRPPYHVFVHTSSSMTYAITSNGALLQLPLVTTFDVIAGARPARGHHRCDRRGIPAGRLRGDRAWRHAGRSRRTGRRAMLSRRCSAAASASSTPSITAFCRSWDKIWAQADARPLFRLRAFSTYRE